MQNHGTGAENRRILGTPDAARLVVLRYSAYRTVVRRSWYSTFLSPVRCQFTIVHTSACPETCRSRHSFRNEQDERNEPFIPRPRPSQRRALIARPPLARAGCHIHSCVLHAAYTSSIAAAASLMAPVAGVSRQIIVCHEYNTPAHPGLRVPGASYLEGRVHSFGIF